MSLSDETGVSSDRGRAAHRTAPGMDISDCGGGDGRCTAYGPTIRRGGAAAGDPGARPRPRPRADGVGTATTAAGPLRAAPPAPTGRPQQAGPAGPPVRAGRGSGADPEAPVSPPPRPRWTERCADRPRPDRCCPGRRPPPAGHPRPPARARPGLRGLRRRCRARLGFAVRRQDHGRLRAERRRGRRRRLLLPLRPRTPRPLSAGLAALRPLLGDGVPGQSGLGVVRGRAPGAGAQPQLRGSVLPVLRPARHRGAPRAGQATGDQGRLDLPGPGRLADRRFAADPGLEPGARPGGQGRGRVQRGARRALGGLPAARHRPRQHGARPALPAVARLQIRRQHRHRRARPDRGVRRPVHLAAAAQQLPLRAVARRGLVRRLPAARVRPLGRVPARAGDAGRDGDRRPHPRGARARARPARQRSPAPPPRHRPPRPRRHRPPCPDPGRAANGAAIRPPAPSPGPWPRSRRTSRPPSAPWASSTTCSTAAASTAWSC